MASSGPNSPGTVAEDTSSGSGPWTGPTNITASDDTKASISLAGGIAQSYYLKATNFGFSIPSGATIDGIQVEWEVASTGGSGAYDVNVKIVKGGSLGTSNYSASYVFPGTDTYKSYGGASDLWGETWADTDINASTFGAAFAARRVLSTTTAYVDHVRITVYYTESAAGQPMALRQSQSRTGFATVGRGF